MVIEKATKNDFPGIHAIFQEVHDHHLNGTINTFKDIDPFTKEEFDESIKDKNTFLLVAKEDTNIIGFLLASIVEKVKNALLEWTIQLESEGILGDNMRFLITGYKGQLGFDIVRELRIGIKSNTNIGGSNIMNQAYGFVGLSTRFYIICFAYILLMELLAVVLHRKYDTKSTLIKIVFVTLYSVITIFKVNILYYQPVLTMLLVIICIINTTNIYYNREERIKMIEA